jgi:hypothetical protein
MNTELESILRRINKLLAIASDTRADANEAAAAASMAEKIMRKYQIEHSDLILSEVKNDLVAETTVASAKTNGTKVKKIPLWADWMALAVAQLNDCGGRKYPTPSGDLGIQYCGYSADVQVAICMFNYLVNAVLVATDTYRKEYDASRQATNSFRKGMSSAITARLNAMAKEKKAEMAVASGGRELMVVKKDGIEEKYGARIFQVAQSKSSTSDEGAFTRGVRKGHSIDIDRRGIKSETTNQGALA